MAIELPPPLPGEPVLHPLPPVPPPVVSPPALLPSNSTNLSLLGGSVAALLVYGASLKGIFLPAGVEAELATVAAALLGYIPRSGRR